MAAITRMGDMDSGHGPFAPVPAVGGVSSRGNPKVGNTHVGVIAGSANVFAGKRPVHRQGDVRLLHISVNPPFLPEISINPAAFKPPGILPWLKDGSETVLDNSVPCGRVGDACICGSVVITGLITVQVGD